MYSKYYPYHGAEDDYPEGLAVDFRKMRVSRAYCAFAQQIHCVERSPRRLPSTAPRSASQQGLTHLRQRRPTWLRTTLLRSWTWTRTTA
jgi:hypothetical protein